VFVVGHIGDWRRAAAVLFERHSLSGHPAPRREARESVAALTANGVGTCGADDNQGQAGHLIPSTGDVSHCLNAGGMGRQDYETETLIAFNITPSNSNKGDAHSGYRDERGLVPVAFQEAQTGCREYDTAGTLRAGGPGHDPVGTRVREGSQVRRLTPRECERLQGFPDDYTLIPYRGKPAADGPRYKALGNSMAVPVMAWIGERIAAVEALAAESLAA
jgi:DNA (cytosine-5)-methyltransferase 1